MSSKCWSVITRLERLGIFNALGKVALLHGGIFLYDSRIFGDEYISWFYLLIFSSVVFLHALSHYFEIVKKVKLLDESKVGNKLEVAVLVGIGLLNFLFFSSEDWFYALVLLLLPFWVVALIYLMMDRKILKKITFLRRGLIAITIFNDLVVTVGIVLLVVYLLIPPTQGTENATIQGSYLLLIVFFLILQNILIRSFTKTYNDKEGGGISIFNWLSFARAKRFLLSFGFFTLILMLYLLGSSPKWGETWASYYFIGVTVLQSLVISKTTDDSECLERLSTLSGLIFFGTWFVIALAGILAMAISIWVEVPGLLEFFNLHFYILYIHY